MSEKNIAYLYTAYKDDVYAYLISLTHDKSLAEDLTSETFLSAIKSIINFKGGATIKTWLFSIARHKWYEHLRKNKKTLTTEDLTEIYIKSDFNLEEKLISSQLIKKIHILLAEQGELKKNIILMRIEGYSFYEIASKYNVSESSARVIDFRVRNKIKDILTKEGYTYE